MSVVQVLSQADIFDEMSSTQLELISSITDERHYQAGDVIFEENTTGDEMYIIANGEIEILVDPAMIGDDSDKGAHIIATMRRGQSLVVWELTVAEALSTTHNNSAFDVVAQ